VELRLACTRAIGALAKGAIAPTSAALAFTVRSPVGAKALANFASAITRPPAAVPMRSLSRARVRYATVARVPASDFSGNSASGASFAVSTKRTAPACASTK